MSHLNLPQLVAKLPPASSATYSEFLRVPAISAGMYLIPSGGSDPQRPHLEDEIYYILSGRGEFFLAGETLSVGPGSFLYVAATAEHRFLNITADLVILVVFAPEESIPL